MPGDKRPNFVFILTDQQRRDSLGCYGNAVASTPNIDRLSREGVTFENQFTANVICSPSRACIFTGRYPRTHGLATNGMALSEDEITLPGVLGANGYRTASVGKLHLAPHVNYDPAFGTNPTGYVSPESQEFWDSGKEFPRPYYGIQEPLPCSGHAGDWMAYYRELMRRDPKLPGLISMENALKPPSGAPSSWKSAIPEEHHCSTWVADESLKFLESAAKGSRPFFLFVGFPDPHFPYCPPAPWCDMFDPASVPMPKRSRDEIKTASEDYARRLKNFAQGLPYHPMDMPDEHVREIIAHTYGMVSLLDKNVGRILDGLDRLGLAEDTVVSLTTDHGEHLGDHWLIYKASIYDELCHLPMVWRWPGRFKSGARPRAMTSHIDLMPTILELAGVPGPRGVQGKSCAEALTTGDTKGRDYVFLEDDDVIGDATIGYCRTLRTPRYRLTRYWPNGDGELFDLVEDPNEFVNRWRDPYYGALRAELCDLMLTAAVESADDRPEVFASC